MKTRGQLEAEISEAIIRFQKEYMGRGPEETKTWLIEDMVLVRLRGVMTPAEKRLAGSEPDAHGRALIKQTRFELLEKSRRPLEAVIESITGRKAVSMHQDMSTIAGEQVILFTLDGCPRIERPEA
ncbi:MAG TPA: DUF2294 domain-containing protein [Planctomycetota bacterium]|nr:DUF2294 domain-containing protein [Planctomycetota bacterium]